MIPDSLTPYVHRVAGLRAVVLEDAWNPRRDDLSAQDRAHALAAAAGRLLRYAQALEAGGEDPSEVLLATAPAWLVLRRARGLLPGPAGVVERLVELVDEAQAMALAAPEPVERSGWERALDRGDPDLAADRLVLLEDADDELSVATALQHLGEALPVEALAASLRIGRHVLQGLSDATRWRIEAVAERECLARVLWTDPVGRYLWMPLAEPDRRAELLSELTGGEVEEELRLVAATSAPERRAPPGEIHLLLWDPRTDRGYTVPFRVEREPSGMLWGHDDRWAPVAWNAIRCGYLAAAATLPSGLPPAPLEAHRVHIAGRVQVDGDSLGLAAALAFYSLWTKQGLPEGCAATGVVEPLEGRVGRVEALLQKVAAWELSFEHTTGPVLVPDQADVPPGATPVRTLTGALAACGLQPVVVPLGDTDVLHRVEALQRCVQAVDHHRLEPWSLITGANPWARLADEIHVLTESLRDEPRPGIDLREARVRAALAWLHAGELDLAHAALAHLGEGRLPPALELLKTVAALSVAIDGASDAGIDDDGRITALLADGADGVEHERYRALGTQGRWRLHRHDPACLPLLREAVDAAPDWEKPRSRIYLAMALRRWGTPDDAWAELVRSGVELDGSARRRSLSYYAGTLVYLRYEQARVLTALGRPVEAIERAAGGLAGAPPGFWPRAGILRAQAVAQRAAGRTVDAEHSVEELQRVAATAPPAYARLMDDLVAEAKGAAIDPPVVY